MEILYTYPHETARTPTKHPVPFQDSLSPRARASSSSPACTHAASRARAFDVVVKPLDNVAGLRLFEIGSFEAEDLVFEGGHVFVQEALFLESFAEVALQFLVVGDSARSIR